MLTRRGFLGVAIGAGVSYLAISKYLYIEQAQANHGDIVKINLSKDEWKAKLLPEQYHILREEGTEPPQSSPLNSEKRKGVFACAGCDLELFKSESKYESGTGWPSFFQPIEGHIETKRDFKMIIPRTEYHCARCEGHQGHVFKDGPAPTGLRYCNNGLALKFIADAV